MLHSAYMSSEMYVSVPGDFLSHASKAMVTLNRSGHTNVIYNLARGIGSQRIDRFPTDRMPMGLIEYIASFY